MRSFNPMFNSLYMTRSTSPFLAAGSSISQNAFRNSGLFAKKVTLSGILNGAQKTIGTVNQIVPLYNQVKPMLENSKVIFKAFKGLKIKEPNIRSRFNNKTYINTQTTEHVVSQKQENKINVDNEKPAKPFFL